MKIYCSQTPELSKAPWYLKPFMLFKFKDRSLEIGFTLPFREFGIWLWWLFPKWLHERQLKECINLIPDYYHKERGSAMGDKVKPFFGWVIIIDEGAMPNWKWWQCLKKYKYD